MVIAIIGTRGIPANYGGFETCAEEISVGLKKKGYEVFVYCRNQKRETKYKTYKGVNLIYLPYIENKYLGTLSHALLSFIHSIFQNYDAILVFNVGLAPLCIIPWFFKTKVFLNVDGLEWKRKKWNWIAKVYFLFCERISSIFTTKIISDSKTIKKYYKQKYNIDSVYIPYGAYIQKSTKPSIINKYCVKKNEYFFIASRLEPENNAELIIKAFKKVQTDKKLLIAGGSNYKSNYVERLNRAQDKRIKLLGPIYKKDHIKELHCNCFAYIHGNEVGGTNPSLLKAMGYGNFILSLNVSYNTEVVGKSALYFEKNENDLVDKLQYVIDNQQIVIKYKQNTIDRLKKYFSWDKVTDSYERLFSQ